MKKKWNIVRENEVKKTMRGRVRSNRRNEKEMKDREREWSKKKTMRGRVRSNRRNEKEMKDREREWSKKKQWEEE